MTTPLVKATLQEVPTRPTTPAPEPITVQFNPTSLRLQMANNVDMKKAFGKRPAVQYSGTSSSTLSFDLVFDTSDEGTTEQPVDARARARRLERFLLPAKGAKAVPPLVRFSYGTFQLIGVMTALNQEFDLFSATGVPLRAKLAVTIKEQMPEYESGRTGPGATPARAPGTISVCCPAGRGRPADRTGTTVAGESAPTSPTAWDSTRQAGRTSRSAASTRSTCPRAWWSTSRPPCRPARGSPAASRPGSRPAPPLARGPGRRRMTPRRPIRGP
ncbi:hypothetical protein ACFQ2B_02750 [Streptomyces stramineus]